MEEKLLNFGQAIELVKRGSLAARKGWNGKGMFIFMRPEDTLKTGMIEKVKSLPDQVKKWIDKNVDDKVNPGESGLTPIKFTAYLCMKAADNTIVNGWQACRPICLPKIGRNLLFRIIKKYSCFFIILSCNFLPQPLPAGFFIAFTFFNLQVLCNAKTLVNKGFQRKIATELHLTFLEYAENLIKFVQTIKRKNIFQMEGAATKKSVVKQVLTIAAGVIVGLSLVKLGEMGIKKALKQ